MTVEPPADFLALPADLPAPLDDRGCDHLPGRTLPDVTLPATSGMPVNPARLRGTQVIYCYPMTARPGVALPEGWDAIPGARGCTPQSCAFRDHHAELRALDAGLHGLSTQTSEYQREAATRLHLTFPLLSDMACEFADALQLPTMRIAGERLIRRLTLIARDARIVKVFYPVFPPDRSAAEVVLWLRANA